MGAVHYLLGWFEQTGFRYDWFMVSEGNHQPIIAYPNDRRNPESRR